MEDLLNKKTLRLEDIPVMSFGKYMVEALRKYGDEEALIDGTTGVIYTFNDVINRTERLAAGLQELGVQKGDVICIVAPNHLEYSILFYATTLIAATLQTVNPLFTKGELAKQRPDMNIKVITFTVSEKSINTWSGNSDDIHRVVKECDSKFIVTIPALIPKIKEATDGLSNIQMIVLGEADGCIPFDSVLVPLGSTYTVPDADWKTTTAVLLSSSGTTGLPKAVRISHFALIANGIQMNRVGVTTRGEVLILFLPMFHIYGLVAIGSTAHLVGSKLILMSRFNADDYLRLIQTYEPITLHVVPPIMVMFAKHPKVNEYDLSSVKTVLCGAAPLSPEIEEAVKRKLSLDYIQQGYGMTETGVTHLNKNNEYRYKSVGKALELTETKILDVDNGEILGINKEGELWIRGPQLSSGYLNLPAQTRELMPGDGWVRTGDIGMEDEEGFLFIVDRLKELIKYKAFQVAPATLEDILLRHEAVADVGVIGVPDEECGELPRAYVLKKAGKEICEKDLQDFVAGYVAPHMKLRGGVEFVTEIPRSLSGKILRRTLREWAMQSK